MLLAVPVHLPKLKVKTPKMKKEVTIVYAPTSDNSSAKVALPPPSTAVAVIVPLIFQCVETKDFNHSPDTIQNT